MDQIFCDASFKKGICGIAALMSKKLWQQKPNDAENRDCLQKISPFLQSAAIEKEGMLAFFLAFPCQGINAGEIKALFLAVRLAEHILSQEKRQKPVEISSDSLIALTDVLGTGPALYRETNLLRHLIKTKKIILSKVKAHTGHSGNSLADEWSKKARKKYEAELVGKGEMKPPRKGPEREASRQEGELRPVTKENPAPSPEEGLAPKESMNQNLSLTSLILNGKTMSAVILGDGRILTKNHSLAIGETNFSELFKERVWA